MTGIDIPENWTVSLKRYKSQWGNDFTENWTLKCRDGEITYKQRVVGPNGEACRREDIDPQDVDPEIRNAFEELLVFGQENLHG